MMEAMMMRTGKGNGTTGNMMMMEGGKLIRDEPCYL